MAEDKKEENTKIEEKEKKVKTKKLDKKEEKIKVEEPPKEKEVKAEVVEEVEVEEETVVEDNRDNTKMIINIVAIVLIVITFALGLILVFKKPSPKYAANDFFSLSVKNPVEAIVKYAISEFDVEVEKEKGKYTTYKIVNVGEIEKENGREIVKVFYTKKGPNSYKIEQEVEEILEKKKIETDREKYKKEFIKELKQVLKEKKDQLEETQDVLILVRQKGERNWTINSDPFI